MPNNQSTRMQRGSVTMIMAAGLVLFALLLLGVGRLAGAGSDRARARTAADASALAGAAEGCVKAAELAVANDGTLLSCRVEGDDVEVDVAVGVASARARARKETVAPAP